MTRLNRGTVIEKRPAYDAVTGRTVYFLGLRLEGDATAEATLLVPEDLFNASCIEGLGQGTVIEYGRVLRIVPPEEASLSDEERYVQARRNAPQKLVCGVAAGPVGFSDEVVVSTVKAYIREQQDLLLSDRDASDRRDLRVLAAEEILRRIEALVSPVPPKENGSKPVWVDTRPKFVIWCQATGPFPSMYYGQHVSGWSAGEEGHLEGEPVFWNSREGAEVTCAELRHANSAFRYEVRENWQPLKYAEAAERSQGKPEEK
jgi:hypothetical protein